MTKIMKRTSNSVLLARVPGLSDCQQFNEKEHKINQFGTTWIFFSLAIMVVARNMIRQVYLPNVTILNTCIFY